MTIELFHDDLPAHVDLGRSVAIDTETTGLSLIRDRLCLVQLSTGNGNAVLVKIKGGVEDQRVEAPRLKLLLNDPSITKIFHFARFDVAVLNKYFGIDLKNIFCTKIASRLARTYSDRHGLKDLCAELLNVNLSKEQQSSDWGASTLSDEQKNYAANDVLYLHQLKVKLEDMLRREGRMALAQACFDFIPHRVALDLGGYEASDVFSHSS